MLELNINQIPLRYKQGDDLVFMEDKDLARQTCFRAKSILNDNVISASWINPH